MFMGVAGGFTAELPKLRMLAACTQIQTWRLVGEAGDGVRRADATAAFRTKGSRGRMRDGRPLDGCVVWRCGRGSKWFVSSRRVSRLKAQKAPDSPGQGHKAPGSFRHTHAADARTVGLGRAEVGGVWAGCVGTGALGPGAKRIPFPQAAKDGGPTTALGGAPTQELALLGRATRADCDVLLHVQDQDCGVAPVRFRWTLGSGHPGPGPGYLPTRHALEPPSGSRWICRGLVHC